MRADHAGCRQVSGAPLAGSPRTPPHRARPPGPASPRLHAATTVTAPRVQVHVAEGESRPCHPPLGGVQAAPCAGRLAAVPRLSPAAGPRAEGVPCEARARALHGRVTVPVLLSRVLFSAEPPPVRAEASGRACRRDCSVPSPGTAQLRCRPGHPAPSWVFREAREGGRTSISQAAGAVCPVQKERGAASGRRKTGLFSAGVSSSRRLLQSRERLGAAGVRAAPSGAAASLGDIPWDPNTCSSCL